MISLLFLHVLLLPELLTRVPFCLGELAPWGKVGIHGEGLPQWMPMKTLFSLFGGAGSQHWGWGLPFTLPGLERKCLQIAGAWTAPLTPVRAHHCQPRPC